MTEVEKMFEEIAAYPGTEPIGSALSFGAPEPSLGYTVARAGDPADDVKVFLYGVLGYCSMVFGSNIDLGKIRKEIFG